MEWWLDRKFQLFCQRNLSRSIPAEQNQFFRQNVDLNQDSINFRTHFFRTYLRQVFAAAAAPSIIATWAATPARWPAAAQLELES